MKVLLLVTIIGLVSAVPKPSKLRFRNLYKEPIVQIFEANPRIVGGQEAVPHSIPYQAFLEVYTESSGWYCGGTLISENYILTAAHCIKDGVAAQITLGAHRPKEIEDSQVILDSTDLKYHEDFDDLRVINDVGVIKLPQPVTLTNEIQVVALPKKSDSGKDYSGIIARISGWGMTDGLGHTVSEFLQFLDVEVISNGECEEIFIGLPTSVVCTSGKDDTGSCGDYGGPLVFEEVQIGVVSFGIFLCLHGFPSGFSRVTSFLDWIEQNTDVVVK